MTSLYVASPLDTPSETNPNVDSPGAHGNQSLMSSLLGVNAVGIQSRGSSVRQTWFELDPLSPPVELFSKATTV